MLADEAPPLLFAERMSAIVMIMIDLAFEIEVDNCNDFERRITTIAVAEKLTGVA